MKESITALVARIRSTQLLGDKCAMPACTIKVSPRPQAYCMRGTRLHTLPKTVLRGLCSRKTLGYQVKKRDLSVTAGGASLQLIQYSFWIDRHMQRNEAHRTGYMYLMVTCMSSRVICDHAHNLIVTWHTIHASQAVPTL